MYTVLVLINTICLVHVWSKLNISTFSNLYYIICCITYAGNTHLQKIFVYEMIMYNRDIYTFIST